MARKYTYPTVNTPEPGDVSVREYCNQRGWKNVQNFYNYFSKGKLPEIEIVMYCGMNIVRPVKKN